MPPWGLPFTTLIWVAGRGVGFDVVPPPAGAVWAVVWVEPVVSFLSSGFSTMNATIAITTAAAISAMRLPCVIALPPWLGGVVGSGDDGRPACGEVARARPRRHWGPRASEAAKRCVGGGSAPGRTCAREARGGGGTAHQQRDHQTDGYGERQRDQAAVLEHSRHAPADDALE